MNIERCVESDRRQLGAMLLIFRDDGLLWIMNDEGKLEECAGTVFCNFQRMAETKKNVPAGGRNGYESVEGTLRAEFAEEVGFCLPEDTDFTLISNDFFLVDQVDNGQMKRLAVSVWATRINKGSELETILSQRGEWTRLSKLRSAIQSVELSNGYRPQLLMATAIASGLLDPKSIHAVNKLLITQSNEIADINRWEIFPGVVDGEGRLVQVS